MTSGRLSKRDRRRAAAENMREVWSDEDFGLRLEVSERGRTRVSWSLDPDPAMSCLALPRFRALLDEIEREAVLELRVAGDSWDEIGWFLGINGESVRRRHQQAEREYLAGLNGEAS